MSASQEKKKRREMGAEQASKKGPEKKSGKVAWIAGGVFAIVIVVLAVFFALVSGGFFQHHTTAATAGSHKLTPAMYNYFYQTAYQTYAYGVDSDTPLDEQMYDESQGITWADYVEDQANQEIARVYAVCDAAAENGFALSESQQEAVDTEVSNVAYYASYYGASSASAYLTAIYGSGCNEDNYRDYVELQELAAAYTSEYAASLVYTDDEVESYYEANRDSLDTVSYRSYLCSVTGDDDAIDEAASQAQAEAFAEAAEGSETAFADQAREYASEDEADTYADDDATLVSDQTLSALPSALSDWLTDESRVYGETAAFASGSGSWYVAQFVDNWTKYDVDTVNIRHILISSTNDDGTENTEAGSKASEVLAEYEAGEQTEEAFGELAKQYSADGNASDGGIYENVYPGQMVDTFNDWCFDASRQPGDTGIVETTFGYHVMYFIGTGDNYARSRVVSSMQSEDATAWADDLGAAMTVSTRSFGQRFVNR